MNAHDVQTPAEYVPPTLVEVGEFNQDTLGDWNGTSPDWFFNYYW